MPEIVFPFAVPVRLSVLSLGDPDCTVNWNFPVTLPLKFPLSINDPVSESPDTKHGDDVEKLKFVTLNDRSPLTLSDVVKLKAVFVSAAVQLPLMCPNCSNFHRLPASLSVRGWLRLQVASLVSPYCPRPRHEMQDQTPVYRSEAEPFKSDKPTSHC